MITLTASADFGFSGQYVARITGRDSKYTFSREFLGRKGGKRNEDTTADVDDLGLYEVCDVTKRGKDSAFWLVIEGRAGMARISCSKEDAMKIAKEMDAGRRFEDILAVTPYDVEARALRERIKTETAPYSDERTAMQAELDAMIAAGRNPATTYEIVSAKVAEKKQSAQTIETATAACWAALESLPAKDAKAILAVLKARLTPAPVAEPTPTVA
jgi:hypothetical protein